MTIRTNKQAIYAKDQGGDSYVDPRNKENLIPISADISKTFLEDNSIENPELRGGFGANDSVIISETQAISIPTFIQGGGLDKDLNGGKAPKSPPVDPLLLASFHKKDYRKNDGTAGNSNGADAAMIRYIPADDEIKGASLLYRLEDIEQKMESAKGTMSLNIEVGAFASMTFELQGPYALKDKSAGVAKNDTDITGTAPTFQPTLAVSGQNTLSVPGLPEEFANCVRSFSLTQGVTISAIDCATREGNNPIKYVQTGRSATGEIVVDVDDGASLTKLLKKWGGRGTFQSKLSVGSMKPNALIVLGTTAGNQFAVASNNYKIGAPTLGDADGIATWTFPITFIPKGGEPDYELYYIGKLT